MRVSYLESHLCIDLLLTIDRVSKTLRLGSLLIRRQGINPLGRPGPFPGVLQISPPPILFAYEFANQDLMAYAAASGSVIRHVRFTPEPNNAAVL
jgi:hypothetical protein